MVERPESEGRGQAHEAQIRQERRLLFIFEIIVLIICVVMLISYVALIIVA